MNRMVLLVFPALNILPTHAQTSYWSAAELRMTCIPEGESGLQARAENCVVRKFERLTDLDGKETWYGLYSNFPEALAEAAQLSPLDFSNVLVLFEAPSGSDRLTPFRVSNPEGSYYNTFDTPRILETDQGTVMYVSGNGAGDGRAQFEYDQYLLWQQEEWIDLDVFGWISQVSVLLPEGFSLDGVYKDRLDLLNKRYHGPVRREKDCHICATGGTVVIELEWQGTSLRLRNVQFDPDALWPTFQ